MTGRGRRRGFGYVRKLPSGRWQASFVGPDLARHSAPHTFETKGDAEGWLGRRQADVVAGRAQRPNLRPLSILGNEPYALGG